MPAADDGLLPEESGDLRAPAAIPGRGKLNIPPDSGAGIWQNGCGAVIEFIRRLLENS
jgi:hypothetical protein